MKPCFMHIIIAIIFYVIRSFLPLRFPAGAVTRIPESNQKSPPEAERNTNRISGFNCQGIYM